MPSLKHDPGTFSLTASSELSYSGFGKDARIVRPRKVRPAAAKREMLEAAREIKRRERELEGPRAELRRDRDRAIVRAVKAGMPMADVGAAFGLSEPRVSQIVSAHKTP